MQLSNKYSKETLPDGSKPTVIPVFERFGRWGVKAEEFLDELAKRARDIQGRKKEELLVQENFYHAIMSYLWKLSRLSVYRLEHFS